MSTQSADQKTGTDQKKRKPLLTIVVGLIFLILVAGGVFLYAGWLGYQEAPKLVEEGVPDIGALEMYDLAPAQETLLGDYGYPEAFTILFYEEEAVDASLQDVRLETWQYYTQGVGFTFINGELTAEDPIDMEDTPVLDPLPYTPEQFSAYMTLDQVLASAGLDTYVEIPLEKEFLEDADLYYGEALTFGMVDGELRYVEALALTTVE
ncbi:MAG: hypothetical protein R6U57_05505 [Anaerolineales bacterium]